MLMRFDVVLSLFLFISTFQEHIENASTVKKESIKWKKKEKYLRYF